MAKWLNIPQQQGQGQGQGQSFLFDILSSYLKNKDTAGKGGNTGSGFFSGMGFSPILDTILKLFLK